jgi:DNA-directed RNA polymerase subunit beta
LSTSVSTADENFQSRYLFKAFGYSTEDLLNYFYSTEKIIVENNDYFRELSPEILKGTRATKDVSNPKTGDVIVKKGRMFTQRALKQIATANITRVPIEREDLLDKVFAFSVADPKTGSDGHANDVVDETILKNFEDSGINEFELLFIDGVSSSDSIRKTLLLDKVATKEEALIEIYRLLRPGQSRNARSGPGFSRSSFLQVFLLRPVRCRPPEDQSAAGNRTPVNVRTLRKEDILLTAKPWSNCAIPRVWWTISTIWATGGCERWVNCLENQYRIGLVRMERAIKERMSLQEVDALMPHDLVNPKPVSAVVKEFFGTSQLSQFMDQTNPFPKRPTSAGSAHWGRAG